MKPSIAIIGAGGLAVTAIWLIADKLGDKYKIKIYDSDEVELSNLNRQILFSINDIGKNKADILSQRIVNKYPNIEIDSFPYDINEENIEHELDLCCAIIDATDSARTSFLVNDYCIKKLKIFSYAGVVGDYGQSLLVNPTLPSACLRCLFGNWEESDYSQIESTCQAAGIIGSIAGYLGMLQALSLVETLKFNNTESKLQKISLQELSEKRIDVKASKTCPNQCFYKTIKKVNLTQKDCPQTFILSKLALEQSESNTNLLFSFKSELNALKTFDSLKAEGKTASWLGDYESISYILSCN